MTSKSKLLSIGKLSIAAMLFLTIDLKIATAADSIALNDMYRFCIQRPGILTCNPVSRSLNIPQAANLLANFPPVTPTNVRATRVNINTERISWNHPGGASFKFYIRLPGNNNFTQAAAVAVGNGDLLGGNGNLLGVNVNLHRADISSPSVNTNHQIKVCASRPNTIMMCSSTINVAL